MNSNQQRLLEARVLHEQLLLLDEREQEEGVKLDKLRQRIWQSLTYIQGCEPGCEIAHEHIHHGEE